METTAAGLAYCHARATLAEPIGFYFTEHFKNSYGAYSLTGYAVANYAVQCVTRDAAGLTQEWIVFQQDELHSRNYVKDATGQWQRVGQSHEANLVCSVLRGKFAFGRYTFTIQKRATVEIDGELCDYYEADWDAGDGRFWISTTTGRLMRAEDDSLGSEERVILRYPDTPQLIQEPHLSEADNA